MPIKSLDVITLVCFQNFGKAVEESGFAPAPKGALIAVSLKRYPDTNLGSSAIRTSVVPLPVNAPSKRIEVSNGENQTRNFVVLRERHFI